MGAARVAALLKEGSTVRDAVRQAAQEYGLPKNKLYKLVMEKVVEEK